MKQLIFALVTLFVSSCVERDNPIDSSGELYEAPSIESSDGIPDNGVVLSNTLEYIVVGNSDKAIYRCKVDSGEWSVWSGSKKTISLEDGRHTLFTELSYPELKDIVNETVSFISLTEVNSFYIYNGSEVNNFILASHNIEDSATSLHLELNHGTITTSAKLGSEDFVQVLSEGNMLDIVVLPGGEKIVGSKDIASLTLDGVTTGDTLSFSILLEDQNGTTLSVNTTLSTIAR